MYNKNLKLAQKSMTILRADIFGDNDVRYVNIDFGDDEIERLAVNTRVYNRPNYSGVGERNITSYTYTLVLKCDLTNQYNVDCGITEKSMKESKEIFELLMDICKDKGYEIHESNL